jgi:phosphatidate phosphatase APP1
MRICKWMAFVILLCGCRSRAYDSDTKQLQEGIIVVSDIDDTIKITNIENKVKMVKNGLTSSAAFAGMSELYGIMGFSGIKPTEYFYLSASPNLLEKNISLLISENKFPLGTIFLRNIISESDIPSYKQERLNAILASSNAKLFLFGDDTEKDPETFLEFQAKNPDRIAEIYIRRNTQRQLPKGVVPFFTAFEVALREFKLGRMSFTSEQIKTLGFATTFADDDLLFPDFAECPTSYPLDSVGLPKEIASMSRQVQNAVEKICKNR